MIKVGDSAKYEGLDVKYDFCGKSFETAVVSVEDESPPTPFKQGFQCASL